MLYRTYGSKNESMLQNVPLKSLHWHFNINYIFLLRVYFFLIEFNFIRTLCNLSNVSSKRVLRKIKQILYVCSYFINAKSDAV